MEITNTENIVDSRDIIDRIEELSMDGAIERKIEYPNDPPEPGDIEILEEYEALKKLEDEAEGSPDWSYGEILIRESYFTEYCQELCQDIGDIPKDLPWYIAGHIDWEGVAREIKVDYMEVDFDGVSYFIRA